MTNHGRSRRLLRRIVLGCLPLLAACSGPAKSGADGGIGPMMAADTSGWTWTACGSLAMTSRIVGLGLTPAGDELVASNQDDMVAWRLHDDFASSERLWRAGAASSPRADLSPGGDWVALSGDERALRDARTGQLGAHSPPPPASTWPQWGTLIRFSPDGRFVAGGGYGDTVEVFSVPDMQPVFGAKSTVLSPGVAFSRDGSLMVTSGPELFRTEGWQPVWWRGTPTAPAPPPVENAYNWAVLTHDETEVIASNCTSQLGLPSGGCRTTRHSMADGKLIEVLPAELGLQPDVSPVGQWLVAGGYLYHLPSHTLRPLDAMATLARFTPTADIIAGRVDGALVKYCRAAQ